MKYKIEPVLGQGCFRITYIAEILTNTSAMISAMGREAELSSHFSPGFAHCVRTSPAACGGAGQMQRKKQDNENKLSCPVFFFAFAVRGGF